MTAPARGLRAAVAVVAVALWGLFRRGSMSDRARPGAEAMDQAEPDPDEPARHEPDEPARHQPEPATLLPPDQHGSPAHQPDRPPPYPARHRQGAAGC